MKGMGAGSKPGLRMPVKVKSLWNRELNKGPESNELPKGVVLKGEYFCGEFPESTGSDGEDW